MKILLVADSHFDGGGREGLEAALNEAGQTRVVEPVLGFSAGLDGVDLVAIYHTANAIDPADQAALSAWVAKGRPLLAVHAALGAWRDWAEYHQWIGRSWVWEGPQASEHPHEEAVISCLNGFEPAINGAVLAKDEVFIRLGENSAVVVLATVKISAGSFPCAWRSKDLPKVAAWMPGHLRESWKHDAMRKGMLAVLRQIA